MTIENTIAKPCKHYRLRIVQAFDHPTPARCDECHLLFGLPEAVRHVTALDAELEAIRSQFVDGRIKPTSNEWLKTASIYIGYAIAESLDGDTGEKSFAIPDLDLDITVDTHLFYNEVMNDLICLKLEERHEQGLMPPVPRDFPELKKLYPSYIDWEWSAIPITVMDYLEPSRT